MKKLLFLALLLPIFATGQQHPIESRDDRFSVTYGNATDSSVEFFWTTVTGAESYAVSYRTDTGLHADGIAAGKKKRFPIYNLTPGTSIHFSVTAIDALGQPISSAGIEHRLMGGECSSSVVPPAVLNGVFITAAQTGSVATYPIPYSSCGLATTPANSLHLGAAGSFSYTMNFSLPVNNLVIVITATGNTDYEYFYFDTNVGPATIQTTVSCFTTVTGNEIASGLGSTFEGGGGGGIFTISAPTNFTSLTITGPGGAAGSLLAICASSVTPVECNVGAAPVLSVTALGAVCPVTTVDLASVTASNQPSGEGIQMTWHAAIPVSNENLVSGDLTSQPAGLTYYAAFYDSENDCYGSASAVTTTTTALIPTFTPIAPICAGGDLPSLPITSNNGVVGNWIPAPNNAATTTYTFIPTSPTCATSTTMTIVVTPNVVPVFMISDQICDGDEIVGLSDVSVNGIAGTWSPPANSNATTTYTFTPNEGVCATTATAEIIVHQKPIVTIEEKCIGQAYVLTAVSDTESALFEWFDYNNMHLGAGASLTIETPGIYNVYAYGEHCEGHASVNVTSTACAIQKGISPNGDASNDVFDLTNLDVANLKIYNRYGMLVYDRPNYANEWSGKTNSGDQLPDAVYYYLIELNDGATKTGWIYLNSKS